MPSLIDLKNKRFGKLVVLEIVESPTNSTQRKWLCLCDCGKTTEVFGYALRTGHTKSCGCGMKIQPRHMMTKSTTYTTWKGMKERCCNPKNKRYAHYGARGISLCDRWLVFENFLADMGERPSDKHSIDRIDNNGNYCPENCRWADVTTQARNKTTNRLIEFNGITQCLQSWANEYNIHPMTLWSRLQSGLSIEQALMTPIKHHRKAFING